MSLTEISYIIYLVISIAMTIWVARTLFRNGRVFLVDTFSGNETLADSVNRLLVVGFYLINLGYINLMLKISEKPETLAGMFESLATKIGLVMLILGGMHFINVYVFSRMRRNALLKNAPPPVNPDEVLRAEVVPNTPPRP